MILAKPAIVPSSARRRLIATLAGAATALGLMTAAALPAHADNGRDLARALAAVAAIAIIAKALEKDKAQAAPVYHAPPPHQGPGQPGWGHGGRPQPGWGQPHPGQGHHAAPRLPAQCAIEFPGNRGQVHVVYAESCLRRAGVQARLPRGCQQQVRIRGQQVTVYPAQCLINAGFRTEGRPVPLPQPHVGRPVPQPHVGRAAPRPQHNEVIRPRHSGSDR